MLYPGCTRKTNTDRALEKQLFNELELGKETIQQRIGYSKKREVRKNDEGQNFAP